MNCGAVDAFENSATVPGVVTGDGENMKIGSPSGSPARFWKTVVQSVSGVQAVTLTRLLLVDPPSATPDVPPPFLSAAGARWIGSDALPAELILVDPASIALTEMQAPA